MINALTDFFPTPTPQKSDFLSFQSERKRVQTKVDRSDLSQTRIQNILLAGEGWNSGRENVLKFKLSRFSTRVKSAVWSSFSRLTGC